MFKITKKLKPKQLALNHFIDQRPFVPADPKQARVLSSEQVAEFNKNGFLLLKQRYPLDKINTFYEHSKELIKINNRSVKFIEKVDPIFEEFYKSNEIISIVEDLNGSSVMHESFTFSKEPGEKRTKPWHQDAIYWNPDSSRLISVFAPLTKINSKNGSLWFFPGSHKLGRVFHEIENDVSGFPNLVCNVEAFKDPVELSLEQGDILVSNDLVIHASFENNSNEERIMMGFHFCNNETSLIDLGNNKRH